MEGKLLHSIPYYVTDSFSSWVPTCSDERVRRDSDSVQFHGSLGQTENH